MENVEKVECCICGADFPKDEVKYRYGTPFCQGCLSNITSTIVSGAPKPGRNELCPCGSGKKFKKCCQYMTL